MTALLWALGACEQRPAPAAEQPGHTAPAGTAAQGLVLGPGDVLLNHLDEVQLISCARTNLASGVRDKVEEFLSDSRRTVPASSWVVGEALDDDIVDRLGLYVPGELRRYHCKPPLGLDLGLGRVRLRHGGRLLETSAGEVGERRLWWFDRSRPMAFHWDEVRGLLFAFGSEAPDEIVIDYDSAASAELLFWEGPEADPLRLHRVSLDSVDRPALALTTPSSFQWRLGGLSGATLELSVAALDVGVVVDGSGRLQRRAGLSDGVTFRVELTSMGVTEVLWERHVAPAARWTEVRVALPRTGGAPAALRFITLPGPDGQRLNDHALWSGLRLRGEGLTDPRPHLVLIDLDTLRADRLGCYGAGRDTSPCIDAWAASSAEIFENATSVESWTLPSTVSMLTGLAVSQHGVHFSSRRMTAAMEPLATRLSAAGYETLARTDGGFVIPAMGFSEGFERFIHRRLHPGEDWSEVLDLLARRDTSRPVFCFVQTYGAHEPYGPDERFDDPDQPYNGVLADRLLSGPTFAGDAVRGGAALDDRDHRWVSDLYDAAVHRTDAMVGEFLDGLAEVFADEPYLVLLTSDHGQALFERGRFGHGLGLHREQLRVPLILARPGAAVVGRRSEPVSGLDVLPTLLDAAGLELPDNLPGRSLLRPLPERAAQIAWHGEQGRSITLDGYKMISEDGGAQLFELASDPEERHDRTLELPGKAIRLAELLQAWTARWRPVDGSDTEAVALSEEELSALEALGYTR